MCQNFPSGCVVSKSYARYCTPEAVTWKSPGTLLTWDLPLHLDFTGISLSFWGDFLSWLLFISAGAQTGSRKLPHWFNRIMLLVLLPSVSCLKKKHFWSQWVYTLSQSEAKTKEVFVFSSNSVSYLHIQGKSKARRVKTIYDCQADNDDELTFVEGEVIIVTGEEDQEWWVSTTLCTSSFFLFALPEKPLNATLHSLSLTCSLFPSRLGTLREIRKEKGCSPCLLCTSWVTDSQKDLHYVSPETGSSCK